MLTQRIPGAKPRTDARPAYYSIWVETQGVRITSE